MRKPLYTTTATKQFRCPAEAVWRVLQSAECYKDWFGLDCTFIDPSFSAGARMTFKNDPTTKIITALESGRRLTLADDTSREEISIEPAREGCAVTLSIFYYKKQPARPGREAEAMLKALRVAAYEYDSRAGAAQDPAGRADKDSPLRAGIRGYTRPVLAADETFSRLIDNTESDIALPRRSVGVVLILAVLLFSILGVSMRFERSDIVPSSGLSLTESDLINREQAQAITFDMTKNELELRLSCQGLRLDSETFYYCSLARAADGAPLEQLYVVYDAFGNVRKYAYIDHRAASERLPIVVGKLADTGENSYADLNSYISTSMGFEEIEQLAGYTLSGFVVDKSGLETLFFGRINPSFDIFDSYASAQMVVKLDRAANSSTVRYYQTFSPNNPLPYELSGGVASQYSQLGEYLNDRYAYDRAFLLMGLTRQQTDILLMTEGVEYDQDEAAGLSYVRYSLRNAAGGEAGYRCEFLITFKDGAVAQVAMNNQRLRSLDQIWPAAERVAAIEEGMGLYAFYGVVDWLPSAVLIDAAGFTLYYGSDNSGQYPLGVAFDATQRVVSVETTLAQQGEL